VDLIFINAFKLYSHHVSLVLLDGNDLVNRFFDVELFDILSKLASIQLSKVKEVVNKEAHQGARGILNLVALLYHLANVSDLFIQATSQCAFVLLHQVLQLLQTELDLDVLGIDGLQRVSELMRDGGIGNGQELILSMHIIVHDGLGNVNQGQHSLLNSVHHILLLLYLNIYFSSF